MNKEYSCPLLLTQQFRFCPNAFRIDMYKGCDFGCKYCFANSSNAAGHDGFAVAKFTKIKNIFEKAFDTDDDYDNITIELLRNRVPLHCGGMSDPFQTREFNMKLTYQLIELSNKYNYPICFSTKTADLPDEYFEILNPQIHAFQISIMGYTDGFIRKYETNTPTAKQRTGFVKKLRNKGFWCSVRIQPLVDITEAMLLVENLGSVPNYITVEHLKIPQDNLEVAKLFMDEYKSGKFVKSKNNMRNIEMRPDLKVENIIKIKNIANVNGVKIGVGDNDLHYMSDSRCCCGIDTINENFNNFLKYNLTYLTTGEYNLDELYIPRGNVRETFNSQVHQGEKFLSYKILTDEYIGKYSYMVPNNIRCKLTKDIFGVGKNSLF